MMQPSPSKLLKTLQQEFTLQIHGHTIELEGDVIWYTKPQGHEGLLNSSRSLVDLTVFLKQLALGAHHGYPV
ncbi:hypothetical protein NT239_01865 [Chitinibacter sp. SCUT-21]|uniref:hypothetical protein n=1 Tax=Chitinibacter sp. SCUT-21 TaxID=2970891 RepID=UPI0035A5CCA6